MRLGVLGGTFDPIHNAHLLLAEQAREQLGLKRVLFVPAGDPWRKAFRRVLPSEHRLAMTQLAVKDDPGFVVDDCEIRREGATYTLADLPFWKDPEAIAEAAHIVVAPRGGVVLPELPFDPDRVIRIKMPFLEISSTDIRERAKAGTSLRYLVPDAVAAYIKEHKLYRKP